MTYKKSSHVFYFNLFAIIIVCAAFFLQSSKVSSDQIVATPLPAFSAPSLYNPEITLTNRNLLGQVYLLNFFASWCSACQEEHPLLLSIKNNYHIPIYGINYKDSNENAKAWLNTDGNPYVLIGTDEQGEIGHQFQVYGTPETFIIDKKGRIRYQYIGTLDENDWRNVLLPLITKYETEKN